MKYLNLKTLAALVILSLISTNALADRLLINDIDQTVSLTRSLDCYSAPHIVIDTSRPEIYGPDPTQLQAISDTVRAILSYECPSVSRINIVGYVRGLEDEIYRAELSAENSWLLPTHDWTAANAQQHRG